MKVISEDLLRTLIRYFENMEAYETSDMLAECLLTDINELKEYAVNFVILEEFFETYYDPDTQEQYFECVRLPSITTSKPLSLTDYLDFAKLRGDYSEYGDH